MVSKLPYAPWGVLETALRLAKSPLETLDKAKNRVGDNFILKSVWGPAYIIGDPVVVEELATELSWNIVHKTPVTTESPDPLSDLFGDSLLSSEGYFHSHYRHVMRDQFTRTRFSDYTSALNQSFEHHSERWQDEQSIEFTEKISDVTLEVISKGMFGFDFSEKEKTYIRKAVNQIFRLETRYLQLGELATSRFSPLSIGYRNTTAKMRALFEEKIENPSRCPFSRNYINDFQARELNKRNPLIDIGRKKIIDDVLGLTVAGLDTVNIAVNWAVRILLQRPDVVEKIRAEADTVLLENGISTQSYDRMPYTKGVILETLRLYPPFPLLIVKQTVEEMEIGSSIVPPKSWLCLLAYSIHRDPRWFEKPEIFQPERWYDQHVARDRSTFLAFGTGTHRCLGWELGLMEATLIVAMLLNRFNLESAVRLKPCADNRIPYTLKVNLHIKGGLPLKLTARS